MATILEFPQKATAAAEHEAIPDTDLTILHRMSTARSRKMKLFQEMLEAIAPLQGTPMVRFYELGNKFMDLVKEERQHFTQLAHQVADRAGVELKLPSDLPSAQ